MGWDADEAKGTMGATDDATQTVLGLVHGREERGGLVGTGRRSRWCQHSRFVDLLGVCRHAFSPSVFWCLSFIFSSFSHFRRFLLWTLRVSMSPLHAVVYRLNILCYPVCYPYRPLRRYVSSYMFSHVAVQVPSSSVTLFAFSHSKYLGSAGRLFVSCL